MARIILENLFKVYQGASGEDVHALSNANLTVEDKELIVLVGPSGCGKSTILRLIAGLEEITGGAILIDGKVVNTMPPRDRDIAMVFQNYALYPHMTVYENMAYALKLRKLGRAEIDQRIDTASEILGLTPYLERLPKSLSGGQRQRVAVGRAIVRQPKVFLFDEPLSNLDAKLRVQMRLELCRLHERLATTIIYVTHDQVEAMTMGDRIAVMDSGRIHQVSDPLNLYAHPADLYVAGFIGSPSMNFFRGILSAEADAVYFVEAACAPRSSCDQIRLKLHQDQAECLTAKVGAPIVFGLRPEDISYPADCHAEPDNLIAARLDMVEPLGAESFIHLTTGAHEFVARVNAGQKITPKQMVQLSFDMSKGHFFDPETKQAIS